MTTRLLEIYLETMLLEMKIIGINQMEDLPQLVATLSHMPGLDREKVVLALKNLPMVLPPVKSRAGVNKLKNILESQGATVSVTRKKLPPAKDPEEGKKQTVPRPLQVPKKKAKKSFSQQLVPLLLILLPVVALVLWSSMAKGSNSANRSKTSKSTARAKRPSPRPAQKPPATQAATQVTPKEKKGRNTAETTRVKPPALTASKKAQILRKQASLQKSPAKAAAMMERSLEHNPYDDAAWEELAENYRQQGNEKKALETEKRQHEQSTKVKKALESIAKTFGEGDKECRISPEKVEMILTALGKDPQTFYDRGYMIYREIRKQHPEKAVKLNNFENGSNVLQLEVSAGKNYPDMDKWLKK